MKFKITSIVVIVSSVLLTVNNYSQGEASLLSNKEKDSINTNGEFTIFFKEKFNGKYSVSITNSIGQIVNQFDATGQSQEINLKEYSNGLYFITISNDKENATVRILKQ